jgi:hypothetical protein
MRIGQIFKRRSDDVDFQVLCITDSFYFGGVWITERFISYHQVGHDHTIYGAPENEFNLRFKEAEQKQVGDE